MHKVLSVVSKYLLCGVVCLMPFLVVDNFLSPQTNAKNLYLYFCGFFVLLSISLSFFYARSFIENKIIGVGKNKLFLFTIINLAVIVLSTIFAFNKTPAFWGDPQRGEGLLAFILLVAMYLGFCVFFEKKEWRSFFICCLPVSSILFAIEVHQFFTALDPNATFGNHLYLATFYIFSLFSSIQVFLYGLKEKNKILSVWGIISFILFILGIFLTATRGTIVALAAGVFVVSILPFFIKSKSYAGLHIKKIGIAIFCSLALFSGLILITRNSHFWNYVPGIDRLVKVSKTDSTTGSRIFFAKTTLAGFKKSSIQQKIIGWGSENYIFFFAHNYDPHVYKYEASIADRSHNKLLDELIMYGVLGLVTYIVMWVYFFFLSFRLCKIDFGYGASVIFFGVVYFVNFLFAFDLPFSLVFLYACFAFLNFKINDKNT